MINPEDSKRIFGEIMNRIKAEALIDALEDRLEEMEAAADIEDVTAEFESDDGTIRITGSPEGVVKTMKLLGEC